MEEKKRNNLVNRKLVMKEQCISLGEIQIHYKQKKNGNQPFPLLTTTFPILRSVPQMS